MVIIGIIGILGLLLLGTISVQWGAKCTVTEKVSTNVGALDSASQQAELKYTEYDESGTLTPDSTIPATKHAQFPLTLSAGAGSIDLTALLGTNGALINGTGLKLRLLRIKNLGTHAMTINEGASNGYGLGTDAVLVVPAGGVYFSNFADGLGAIGSGAKTIDVAGNTTESAEVSIVLG